MSISFELYFQINLDNLSTVCSPISSIVTPDESLSFENSNVEYVPNSYDSLPNIKKGVYTVPSSSISTAYYNVHPFLPNLFKISPSSNDSSSIVIFGVSYTIEDIKEIEDGQLYDLIYLYYYLSKTFSSNFLSSNYFKKISKPNLVNMITNYCQLSSNMGLGLCSSTSGIGTSLPYQDLITQSPCTDPYSKCYDAWDNYCFQSGNYDSSECLNYYSNSYENNQLNANIKNGLLNVCQSIYRSDATPPENFWEICSCFLPEEVYTDFLKKNNVSGISQGTQQCWYYPCISATVLPESSPTCPNSSVVSCIQKQYLTLDDTGGNISDDTIKTQQAINNCQALTSTNKSTKGTNSSPLENTTSPIQRRSKKKKGNTNPIANNYPPSSVQKSSDQNTSSGTSTNKNMSNDKLKKDLEIIIPSVSISVLLGIFIYVCYRKNKKNKLSQQFT